MMPRASAVAAEIRGLPFARRLDAIVEYMAAAANTFEPAGAGALFEALQPSSPAELASAMDALDRSGRNALTVYFQARLRQGAGDLAGAATAWTELFTHTPSRDPLLLLHAARVFGAAGQWDAAALRLREALSRRPDYTFHARARGIVKQVAAHSAPGVRRAKVALLGTATTSLLVPVLETLCFRDRLDVEWYEGLFGAWRQEILDPASGLYRFSPDVVFIMPTWRTLDLPSLGSAGDAQTVEGIVAEHVKLWEMLSQRSRCHIVQQTFDLPAIESAGDLAAGHPGGRTRVLRRVNARLAEAAHPQVTMLDTERLVACVGLHTWEDAALWQRARQHPAPPALPALAEQQMAHLRAILGLTRKVVVCDLDNTLWGGVIGEDGLDGIAIGSSSPEGEAHAELQRYLKELRSRGILLAVASKNNPEEARLPFAEHPGMILRLDDFAAFEANWDDKATNLRRLADRLSLGTDSFVFLDDNPLERAWIRAQLPEVAVVELGRSAATFVRDLDAGRYFEAVSVSAEDRVRADQYGRESERAALREQAGSVEEFLAGLQMRGSVAPVTDANLARVTQLVNKTNQFNVTTRRYTDAQVMGIAAAGGWCGAFELSDRFGDHGIIGVLFCVPAPGGGAWEIDTWLMSCRVLGRQFEHFMLDRLVDAARAAGVPRVVGVYRATAKNGLVSDLFDRLGFRRRGETAEGVAYELDLASVMSPYTSVIDQLVQPRHAPREAARAKS